MKLTIKGKPRYINYLFSHLKEEHPSTRKRMRKGQTAVIAVISVGFLLLGLILFIPLLKASGSIMGGNDGFLNLLGAYSWLFVLFAVIAAFLVWNRVGVTQ
jgi:hypothetical protein